MTMDGSISAKVRFAADSDTQLRLENGLAQLTFDLAVGEFAFSCCGACSWSGIHSAFRWQGREYHTGMYESHQAYGEPKELNDRFGQGVQVVVRHEKPGLPEVEQHFYLYEQQPFFLIRVVVVGEDDMKLNRIAVMKSAKLEIEKDSGNGLFGEDQLHALRIPYDNDKWVRYIAKALPWETESYEAAVLFYPGSRQGFVTGSVSHDVWKTGIRIRSEQPDKLDDFELYAGATSEMTRDTQPHGYVHGPRVASPLVFAGYYDDYREGLEAYGRANAAVEPPLKWEGGVPFGWNSWSAAMSTLDYELYVSTSDFLKREVQPLGFESDGALYINFDAFWDRLTAEEMADALRRVRANGHKPGTYWTPFAFWGGPEQFGREVEGTDGKYTYGEILLRDAEGEIVADIAGGLAIDPTHPGALRRIDWFTEKVIREGFEYIKLDFMAHGALEGKHDDPAITTGIAAYRHGLSYLAAKLSPEAAGRPFFINLSIAPLFPYAFAHSRRFSCDVFGQIGDTEYLLNSLTYGWWMNDSLYRFNDPDHTVLYKSFNQEATGYQEGRSRLTAATLAGTLLLLGDDFRKEGAAERARAWLGNRAVMDVARLGRTFRPLEWGFGDRAADVFVLEAPGSGTNGGDALYVAAFNFDGTTAARKTISLARAGLDPKAYYRVVDLWEGKEHEAAGQLVVDLAPAEAKIFKLSGR